MSENEWPCRFIKNTWVGVIDGDCGIVEITYRHDNCGTSVMLKNEDAYAFAEAVAQACRQSLLTQNGPCISCKLKETPDGH